MLTRLRLGILQGLLGVSNLLFSQDFFVLNLKSNFYLGHNYIKCLVARDETSERISIRS